MAIVDSRVVSMNYDGMNFVKHIQESEQVFEHFKDKLSDSGSILGALDKINSHFSLLATVSTTTIAKLTTDVLSAGKRLYSATVGQILSGGKLRSLNIEQAQFMFKGLGMNVQEAMQNATDAVTDTAYGLDEAAKATAALGACRFQLGEDMTACGGAGASRFL